MQSSLLKFNSQDTMVLGKNARHSFGRAQDRIPAPTRKQFYRKRIGNDTKRRPVNDHKDARAGVSNCTRSEARKKARKRDSIRRMWIGDRERNELGKERRREGRT